MIVKLCPVNNRKKAATQKCFDDNVLPLAETGASRFYIPKGTPKTAMVEYQVALPRGLTCEQCVIQWTWTAGMLFIKFSLFIKIKYSFYKGVNLFY